MTMMWNNRRVMNEHSSFRLWSPSAALRGACGAALGLVALVAVGGCSTGGEEDPSVSKELRINEICASNGAVVVDNFGGAADWLEIYNPASEAVDLAGWFVSDKEDNLYRFALPSVVVPAGGYLLLWADDDLEQTDLEGGHVHLPFKLKAAAEGVYLSSPGGTLVDGTAYSSALRDSSYARIPNGEGEFTWCSIPTPGASNGSSCE